MEQPKRVKDHVYHQLQSISDNPQPTPRIVSPEEKSAFTKENLSGRITFWQYEKMVFLGFDGETINRWTKHRASLELEKLLATPEPTTQILYDHKLTLKLKRKKEITAYTLGEQPCPTPVNQLAVANDGQFYIYHSRAEGFDKKGIRAYGSPAFLLKKDAVKLAKAAKMAVVSIKLLPSAILTAGMVDGVPVLTARRKQCA